MKLFIFFSIITIIFNSKLQSKEVFTNATAIIFNENKVNAKEQALKNALLKAVKKGVENIMDLKSINANYRTIKNNIYSINKNFIKEFEILKAEEIIQKNLYKVSIKADVNLEKIREKIKFLRILNEKNNRKKILVFYISKDEFLAREKDFVTEILKSVNKSFSENSFLIFDTKTINEIHITGKEGNIVGNPTDSLISLSHIFKADILVIIGMNYRHEENLKESFFKVSLNMNFSIFDTLTGKQIAETSVTSFEKSVKKINNFEINNLLQNAGRQVADENVRKSVSHIKGFYQNLGFYEKEYSIIFKNYFWEQENIIIDYFENNSIYKNVSELNNSEGFLELELFYKKRKSILRRKIISDLLEKGIDVALKSLPGNRLIFLNPNSIEDINNSDNSSKISTKN